jgi:hypothetical protein
MPIEGRLCTPPRFSRTVSFTARLRYGPSPRVNEATNTNEAERRRAARKRFRAQYRALYDELLEILFQLDPVGVHSGNAEKFVPEATTIMARLREARVAEDVEQIIQQELRRWYGRRHLSNLDPERLTDATIAVCRAWNRFLESSAS